MNIDNLNLPPEIIESLKELEILREQLLRARAIIAHLKSEIRDLQAQACGMESTEVAGSK
jgi:hypothetical protein